MVLELTRMRTSISREAHILKKNSFITTTKLYEHKTDVWIVLSCINNMAVLTDKVSR